MVQRYDMDDSGCDPSRCGAIIDATAGGRFVFHSDYATLTADHKRLCEAVLVAWRKSPDHAFSQAVIHAAQQQAHHHKDPSHP